MVIMNMNKDEFFKTEFGKSLTTCIMELDYYRNDYLCYPENETAFRSFCDRLSRWDVYRMAIKTFYGLDCHYTFGDEYYGVACRGEPEETCFLVKYCSTDRCWFKVCKSNKSCVSGPFTHKMRRQYENHSPDADSFIFMTSEAYYRRYRVEVETQM